ncbi:MAG: hypothetical protein KC684_10005 [Candidatus Omnitrophica bacterium]|nr:hypothetical protein [Candidatus Omnitrophota bacterium]
MTTWVYRAPLDLKKDTTTNSIFSWVRGLWTRKRDFVTEELNALRSACEHRGMLLTKEKFDEIEKQQRKDLMLLHAKVLADLSTALTNEAQNL